MTFLGGFVGSRCESLLQSGDGLDPIVVRTEAPTRVILTVLTDGTTEQTAFFDPDPAITPSDAEELYHKVEEALSNGTVEALTLSGSSPAPATHGLYSDLIALAHARRVPVFLDTYGPALDGIWGFWPTAIQLNRREAAIRLRKTSVTDDDVAALLRDWDRRGVIMRRRHRRAQPGLDPVSRPAVPSDPAPDQGGQSDRLGRLALGRPGRRLAEPARARAAVPSRDRLRGRQRPGMGRRCHRAGRGGAMEQAGCHRAGVTRAAATDGLVASIARLSFLLGLALPVLLLGLQLFDRPRISL